jgi:hypothetical protein
VKVVVSGCGGGFVLGVWMGLSKMKRGVRYWDRVLLENRVFVRGRDPPGEKAWAWTCGGPTGHYEKDSHGESSTLLQSKECPFHSISGCDCEKNSQFFSASRLIGGWCLRVGGGSFGGLVRPSTKGSAVISAARRSLRTGLCPAFARHSRIQRRTHVSGFFRLCSRALKSKSACLLLFSRGVHNCAGSPTQGLFAKGFDPL